MAAVQTPRPLPASNSSSQASHHPQYNLAKNGSNASLNTMNNTPRRFAQQQQSQINQINVNQQNHDSVK
jgi:hypothetical protein